MRDNFAKEFLVQLLTETLEAVPAFDDPEIFSIKKSLLIKDDDTGIEYTVSDVDLSDGNNPTVKCYRYNPDKTRAYLEIDKQDFKNYSRV